MKKGFRIQDSGFRVRESKEQMPSKRLLEPVSRFAQVHRV